MSILLFFIVFIGNLVLVLVRKKSKPFEAFSFLVLILLYTCNQRSGLADLTTYRNAYNGEDAHALATFEPGYVWVTKILARIGLPFQGFLFLIIVVSFAIYIYIMREILIDAGEPKHLRKKARAAGAAEPSYSCFLVLFCCFYYFFALEVLRFFIATGLVVLGLYERYREKHVRFLALILIAFLFHKAALYFVIFLLVTRKLDVRHYQRFFLVLQLLCLAEIFMGNRIPFAAALFRLVFGSSKAAYFDSATRLGFLYYFLYYYFTIIMNLACIRLMEREDACHHVLLSRGPEGELTDGLYRFAVFCLKCNYLTSVSLPLVIMNVTQFRFNFVISLLTFFLVAAVSGRYIVNQKGTFVSYSRSQLSYFLSVFVCMAIWTGIWWMLKINVAGMLEALSYITI